MDRIVKGDDIAMTGTFEVEVVGMNITLNERMEIAEKFLIIHEIRGHDFPISEHKNLWGSYQDGVSVWIPCDDIEHAKKTMMDLCKAVIDSDVESFTVNVRH